MVTVRPWRPEDGEAAAEIVRAVFDEYGFAWDADYCADLYDIQGHYLDRGHLFWLAEFEGRPVGTGALELFAKVGAGDSSDSSDSGNSSYPEGQLSEKLTMGVTEGACFYGDRIRVKDSDCSLERLYVRPDARRLGAGQALFQTTILEAHRQGREVMEIWSDKLLTKAHSLYEKYGAEVVADRLCDDPDESPEWGLRLEIAKALGHF
jgi:putative acetyltransferase